MDATTIISFLSNPIIAILAACYAILQFLMPFFL